MNELTKDTLAIARELEREGYRKLPKDKPPLLSAKELKKHWKWVDDGDGYNQRQDWNITTLLEAQREIDIKFYTSEE